LRRAYAEAARGIDVYCELLRHADARTRASAAVLLACFDRHRERIAPLLRAAVEGERDRDVRACLAFALGRAGESRLLRALRTGDVDPLVRLQAAIALARIVPDREVVELIAAGFTARYDVGELACSSGDLGRDLAAALAEVTPELAEPALPLLLRALAEARSFGTIPIVRAILRAAFPEPADDQPPLTEATLTQGQREVLTALVSTSDMWSIANVTSLLSQHGLPWDRRQAAELAGADFRRGDLADQVGNACILSEMGFACDALERFEAALAQSGGALDAASDPARAWMRYASTLARTPGRDADAASAFGVAAARSTAPVIALVERARCFGRLGRRPEQLDAAVAALAIEPASVPALVARAEALLELGRVAEARQCASRAVELAGDDLDAQWQMACAAAAAGDLDGGIGAARQLLALDPDQRERLRCSPRLASLRERIDFRRLLSVTAAD
jgi:hypothetical protein